MMIQKKRNKVIQVGSLLILCAIWFLIGWVGRGYRLEPEIGLVEQVYQKLSSEYYGELSTSRELSYAAIRGMLRRSGDQHAALLEPPVSQRFWDDFRGSSGVIGVIADKVGDEIVVLAVFPGDPGDQAGLRVGDVILSVDGVAFDEDTTEAEASILIRGPVGTPAQLIVKRGDEILELQAVREERVVISSQMLPGGVAYLAQYRFTTNAAELVKEALQSLLAEQPKGLIWDLRFNGGGSMETTQEILGYFIEDGVLFLAETRDGEQRQYRAQGEAFARDIPLVVLTGPGTYSSAETAAAAIRERGQGTLVGETTHGKGSIQTTTPLLDGSMLQFTVARWLSPSGEWFEGRGVQPDIPVSDDPETPEDEVLEFAIGYLLNP